MLSLLNAHYCAISVVRNKEHRDDDDDDRVEYFLPDSSQHTFDRILIHNLDDHSNNHELNGLALNKLFNISLWLGDKKYGKK